MLGEWTLAEWMLGGGNEWMDAENVNAEKAEVEVSKVNYNRLGGFSTA